MLMQIQRGIPVGQAIPGEMTIGDSHACFTLERRGVQIPAGTYPVGLYPSPHFGRLMPIVESVPGRSDILIHWGNYPQNSEGCILVGEQRDLSTGEIFNTQKQFDALFPAIEAAVRTEGCQLQVMDSIACGDDLGED